jgi:uncharacterized protein YebE (UPF0316 family)
MPAMEVLASAILIFFLRITDVSIGTVRVIYTIRGHRVIAMTLGFFESLIWIYAISRLSVAAVGQSFPLMLGWAAGFAAGTALGITLEQWIAVGSVIVRIISVYHFDEIRCRLRDLGFGVTSVNGEGREGSILILFVAAPRKRIRQLLPTIQEIDPDAFVTVEFVSHAIGGYLPISAASVRK